MKRYSSAVAISILGFCFAYGCSTDESGDDDDDQQGSTTTVGIDGSNTTGSTGSGGTNGSGNNTASATSDGSGGTGGGGNNDDFAEACPDLAESINNVCDAGQQNAKPKPVNMLIVLDKSGSMDDQSNGTQKWGAMKSALDSALRASQDLINFGLEMYPFPHLDTDTIDKDGCGQAGNCCEMPEHGDMNVPVGTGAAAVDAILSTLDNTEPGGGTPTSRALERALDYFTNGPGSNLEGDKYVLLATDGGPNCNDQLTCGADLCTYNLDNPDVNCENEPNNNCCATVTSGCVDSSNVVDRIERLADAGIGTFVVGIPGSEAYSEFLNDFAEAGGRPSGDDTYSYYRVDDVADLTDVFDEITTELVTSCEIELPVVPPTTPIVAINCERIPRFEGAAGAGNSDGPSNYEWEGTQLTLMGSACEQVEAGVERIDIILGCEDVF